MSTNTDNIIRVDVSNITIGSNAGGSNLMSSYNQGDYGIAIGYNSGVKYQEEKSIAIGYLAGKRDQSNNSIAIGSQAAEKNQNYCSIAIGNYAGHIDQSNNSIAIGSQSGEQRQKDNSIAIGHLAGQKDQSNNSIAIGHLAGQTDQSNNSIAIGLGAGTTTQKENSIAIGYLAGNRDQSNNSIAIGYQAGRDIQGENSIAIGRYAATYKQSNNSIAIGQKSGFKNVDASNIAIGYCAGHENIRSNTISIGYEAGYKDMSLNSIAIGHFAGRYGLAKNSINIGRHSNYAATYNSLIKSNIEGIIDLNSSDNSGNNILSHTISLRTQPTGRWGWPLLSNPNNGPRESIVINSGNQTVFSAKSNVPAYNNIYIASSKGCTDEIGNPSGPCFNTNNNWDSSHNIILNSTDTFRWNKFNENPPLITPLPTLSTLDCSFASNNIVINSAIDKNNKVGLFGGWMSGYGNPNDFGPLSIVPPLFNTSNRIRVNTEDTFRNKIILCASNIPVDGSQNSATNEDFKFNFKAPDVTLANFQNKPNPGFYVTPIRRMGKPNPLSPVLLAYIRETKEVVFTDISYAQVPTINNNGANRIITGSATANTLEAQSNLLWDNTDTLTLQHPRSNLLISSDFDPTTSPPSGGLYNIGIGKGALNAGAAGGQGENVCIGRNSGKNITSGYKHTAVGHESLTSLAGGEGCVAIGHQALEFCVGSLNIGIGTQAGEGAFAGSFSGANNVIIGSPAGAVLTTASTNVIIGNSAGGALTTGTGNILLGYKAGNATGDPGGQITNQSNHIILGNVNCQRLYCAVALTASSDGRDKTEITDFMGGLDFVKKMKPVTYKWDKRCWYLPEDASGNVTDQDITKVTPDGSKKENITHVGFIAQDIETLEKEIGFANNNNDRLFTDLTHDGMSYGMRYDKIVTLLVNSVKELSIELDATKARIAALETP